MKPRRSVPPPGRLPPRARHRLATALALPAMLAATAPALADAEPDPNSTSTFARGLPTSPEFFPIAVWLQPPARAQAYRNAGFNLYVGLWQGPTDAQLDTLRDAGMRVICDQNDVGRRRLDDPTIVGWMHGDEPDNAQSLGPGKGYGPPIPPAKVIADYRQIRQQDPSRPVLLNLGQGVAWDDWHGRGVRTRHPEDYLEYVQGADIVSFDIYPVTHDRPAVSSNLWYVARGVERLIEWTGGRKPVWNCIECTRISHPTAKPTPHHVRAEVWMSLIHGSRGLIYFVHEWQPRFNESALLDDPEMLAAVSRLNHQIHRLAPVLNSPSLPHLARVTTEPADVPVAFAVKQHGDATYLFAVAMRDRPVQARFTLPTAAPARPVEVLGEDRSIPVVDGTFTDTFHGWDVRLYRLPPP